jgi:Mn-dependent DtxR family transcriptional regulator
MTNNFGGKVTSSLFTAMDFSEAEKLEADIENMKLQIMRIIKSGGASKAGLARMVMNSDSDSAKGKVHRLILQLRKDGLMEPKGDYRLTEKGQKYVKNI